MVTYGNTSNITGFAGAFDYTGSAINSATGYDVFGPLLLGMVFLGFFLIGSRYTQERALLFSAFMTTIAAFIMVSGSFLDPKWMVLPMFATVAAVFFANRVS